jgi:hypothetical protein
VIEDREQLIGFLTTLRTVINEVLERPPGFLDPEMRTLFLDAWLEVRGAFDVAVGYLQDDELDEGLARVGLTSLQLSLKLGGFRRALQHWFNRRTRGALRRLLAWADTILDSLAAVMPPAEVIREYKECLKNEADYGRPRTFLGS